VITTPSHTGNKKGYILEEKLHIAPLSNGLQTASVLAKANLHLALAVC